MRVVAFICAAVALTACGETADPVTAPITTGDQTQTRPLVYCVYQGQNYSVGAVVNFGGPAAAKCAADGTWQGY